MTATAASSIVVDDDAGWAGESSMLDDEDDMKRLLYPRTAVSRSAVLTKPPGGARAAVYRWPGAVDFCAALRSYTAVSAAASGDD